MPEYRKLHNCFDMGERTEKLTDFEFRVWSVYRAAADDYGVCPLMPAVLKGKSRRLAGASDAVVRKAMERLIGVGLCVSFEHQGLRYLCQTDWQDYEDVRFPRNTDHPAPPPELIGTFTEKTRKLFGSHTEKLRTPARAGGRETLTLTETQTQTVTERERGNVRHYGPSVSGLSPLEWDRKHGAVHVTGFCDWVCFPNDLHREFAQRVTGLPVEEAFGQVLAWAWDIRKQWHGRIVPDGSPWDFWRHRWTETHGGSKPVTGPKGDGLDGLRAAVRNG